MNKHHKLIGQLPIEIVNELKSMIMKKYNHQFTMKRSEYDDSVNDNFQRIDFDDSLTDYLKKLINTDLEVQKNPEGTRWIQRAFYSNPDFVYPIHRDGIRCKSALNIAIQCNDNDWVRWYESSVVNSEIKELKLDGLLSRETNMTRDRIESLDYIEEFKSNPGDIYLLDVDTFHTWKCSGPEPRIIIQTKFKGFPDFKSLVDKFTGWKLNYRD